MSQSPDGQPEITGNADPTQIEAEVLRAVGALVREVQPDRGGDIHVSPASRLDRDLGLDSLARAELLLRLETIFQVSLPEGLLSEAETPADLAEAAVA